MVVLPYFSCNDVQTDQTCAQYEKTPRMVYANPFRPEVCPVLALANHLAMSPEAIVVDVAGTGLFRANDSNNVYSRITTTLKDLRSLQHQDLAEALHEALWGDDGILMHMWRKGVMTMLAAIDAGPSYASICLRSGHSMGTVSKYAFPSPIGDAVCGRFCACLPHDSVDVAQGPPFFPLHTMTVQHRQWLKEAVLVLFCVQPDALKPQQMKVLEMCLASQARCQRRCPFRITYGH